MHQSKATLLSLLAITPTCLALGSARIVNNCGTTVYFASVKDNNNAQMQALPASGYSEAYSEQGTGVSIKMSTGPGGKVAQFEFTWANGQISYDISNIDGNPFAQQGVSLVPSVQSSSAFPSCVAVNCPAGGSCASAYNNPDDVATKVCSQDTSLTFTLCTDGKLAGTSGTSSSAGASARVSSNAAGVKSSAAVKNIQTSAGAKSGTPVASNTKANVQSAATGAVQANLSTKVRANSQGAAATKQANVVASNTYTWAAAQTTGSSRVHQKRRIHTEDFD